MSEKKGMSRRQFVTGTVVAAAATTVPMLANVTTAAAVDAATAVTPLTRGTWPGTMTGLDAKALARQAYETYKGMYATQSACCEATFWPIIGALAAAETTANFAKLPRGTFNYGGGGINTWRSICGCTNAGAAMLKIVTNNGPMIDEFLTWYEKTLLPTNATYLDYAAGGWTPGAGVNVAGLAAGKTATWGGTGCAVPYNNAPKSKAQSVLCHSSLTNWRLVASTWEATKPAAQSDRCGKLCYDVVYKLATMINAWMAGTNFAGTLDASINSCGEGSGSACHGATNSGGLINGGHPYAQGKMKCTPCHDQRIGDGHNL